MGLIRFALVVLALPAALLVVLLAIFAVGFVAGYITLLMMITATLLRGYDLVMRDGHVKLVTRAPELLFTSVGHPQEWGAFQASSEEFNQMIEEFLQRAGQGGVEGEDADVPTGDYTQ